VKCCPHLATGLLQFTPFLGRAIKGHALMLRV
jgi:hypothetical protein